MPFLQPKSWALISILLFCSPDSYSLGISLIAGSQTLDRSEILITGKGSAAESALRVFFFPQSGKHLSLGASFFTSKFAIEKNTTVESATYKQDGFFENTGGGLDVTAFAVFSFVRPYLRMSYLSTVYSYKLTSSTNYLSSTNRELLTKMDSQIEFNGKGVDVGAGVRVGDRFGVILEYAERRETLTVSKASLQFENYADGVKEAANFETSKTISDFRKLVGSKMLHAVTSLHLGIDYQF